MSDAMPSPCIDCPFRPGTAEKIDATFNEDGLGEAMISFAKDTIRKYGRWSCHKTLADDASETTTTRECWGSPRYRRALPLINARMECRP